MFETEVFEFFKNNGFFYDFIDTFMLFFFCVLKKSERTLCTKSLAL